MALKGFELDDVAYHEAAHAVGAAVAHRVRYCRITRLDDGSWQGRTGIDHGGSANHDRVVAGLAGYAEDLRRNRDKAPTTLEEVKALPLDYSEAEKAATAYSRALDERGEPQRSAAQLLEEGWDKAKEFVLANLEWIDRVAAQLVDDREIDHEGVKALRP